MVRLKVLKEQKEMLDNVHFNSNMVRLKVISFESNIPSSAFQFQYGSIKSNRYMLFVPIHLLFQFQYGSIKSRAFDN